MDRRSVAPDRNPLTTKTTSPMFRLLSAALALAAFAAAASHAEGELTPPAALVLDNVPPVSVEVAKKIAPYAEFRPHGMLSWHPEKREMLIRRRLTATSQVHLLTVHDDGAAGGSPLAGDRSSDRGAAATDQPIQPDDLAGRDIERHALRPTAVQVTHGDHGLLT